MDARGMDLDDHSVITSASARSEAQEYAAPISTVQHSIASLKQRSDCLGIPSAAVFGTILA
jgi:hypothetical protein